MRQSICCNSTTEICLRDYETCILVTPVPSAPAPHTPGELLWAFLANISTAHPVGRAGNDVVIATTAAGVQAFNTTTGAVLWTFPTMVKEHNVLQNGTTLYVVLHGFSGVVVALDVLTGGESWRLSVPPDVNVMRFASEQHASAPILFLHTQDDNFAADAVFAVNATSGVVLWNTTQSFYAEPVAVNGICALSNNVFITGVNCLTGALVWSTSRTMLGSGSTSLYALPNSHVFIATFNEWSSLEITALDAATGAVMWNHTQLNGPGALSVAPNQQSVLLLTADVSGARNFITSYDVTTGELLWSLPSWTDSYFSISMLAVTPTHILGGYAGGYTFAAFLNNGTTAWNVSYSISSTDVTLNDDMTIAYAGVESSIGAVVIATGRVQWSHDTQLPLKYAPLTVGSTVIGGALDTYLYGIRG